MSKPRIGIIVGSTRPGRFGDKPAEWIAERARATGEPAPNATTMVNCG